MPLGSLGELFVEIGADTSGLDAGVASAGRSLSKLEKAEAKAAKKRQDAVRQTVKGAGVAATAIGAVSAVAIASSVRAFIDMDSAMASVRKTTGLSGDALNELQQEFIDLSKKMPLTASELAGIGAVAGQLGITGKKNIAEFTETAAKMATAFDISAESAATALAKLSNIYDIPISETDRLASAINTLGNTTAAKESQILDFTGSLGAAGRVLGFSATETVAMGASLISMGQDASDAGTRLNSAFSTMAQNTDEAGALLGITGDQFSAAFGSDQIGTLQALITEIMKIEDPLERNTVAAEVFGRVGSKAIIGLGANIDGLTTNLKSAQSSYEENTSLTEEYANATDTMAAKMAIANNNLTEAKRVIGEELAPVLTSAATALGKLAGLFSDLPGPVKTAIAVLLGIGVVVGIIGVALIGVGSAMTAYATITAAAGATSAGASVGFFAAAAGLWAALAPLLPFIAAAALLIGALYLLWRNFGLIKEAVLGASDGFLTLLGPVGLVLLAIKHWDEIGPFLSSLFTTVVDTITTKLTDAYNAVRDTMERVLSFLSGLNGRFYQSGFALLTAFANGIKAAIGNALAAVRSAASKLRSYMPGSDAEKGPLSDITASGAALMDTFAKGMESGTDLNTSFGGLAPAIAPQGAGGAASGGNGGTTININKVELTEKYDFDALMKDINAYQRGQAQQRGVSFV